MISVHCWVAAFAMFALTFDSGYFIERQQFTHLIFTYSLLFATYLFILKKTDSETDARFWFIFAFLLRGSLTFSFPNLSDDIYRFVWDGRLIHLGVNPFDFKPSYFVENQLFSSDLTPELYQKLNSKNYFTVYPSVCQALFAFATWLFPKSLYGAAIVIKIFLTACDFGTLFLMKKMLKSYKKTLIYALNPLIIIELCGNAHFEAAMIFFFLLSIFLLKKIKINPNFEGFKNAKILSLSALFFALSVASKMLSFLFLPFLTKKMGWKKSIFYFGMVGGILLLFFLPLYNDLFINNIQSSLNLYFEKFEFNASLYYLLREVSEFVYGFNFISRIAVVLRIILLLSLALIFFFDLKNKNENEGFANFFEKCLFALSVYFLCATTVHPWYASMLLALSVFTQFRYPAAWTYFIFLTYIHYSYPKPTENFWVIALEYSTVIAFALWEISKKKKKEKSEQFVQNTPN